MAHAVLLREGYVRLVARDVDRRYLGGGAHIVDLAGR